MEVIGLLEAFARTDKEARGLRIAKQLTSYRQSS